MEHNPAATPSAQSGPESSVPEPVPTANPTDSGGQDRSELRAERTESVSGKESVPAAEKTEAPAEKTEGAVGAESAPVAGKLTAQLTQNQFSVQETIGGWQGLVEATVPTIVLLVAYALTKELLWPGALALGAALLFTLIRLVQRSSLRQAISGLIATLICVAWTWHSGKVEDFFTLGFWIDGVYGVVLLLTIGFKRPAIGWLAAAATGRLNTWRQRAERQFYRHSLWATWIWVGLMGVRLVVELPLYYFSFTAALGIARIVLGLPAFALVVYLTWLLMRPFVNPADTKAAITTETD